MSLKFDTKYRKILHELDQNANILPLQLAKKVGVSRQVAEYRIQKLMQQKTIYAFYTLIDAGKLGYSTFRVHIRLKNATEERYSHFAQDLFHHYPAFWVGFVSGSFDIIADIFARNPNEFELIFKEVLQKNKEIIHSYETLTLLELDLYEYAYFTENRTERTKTAILQTSERIEIDKYDQKILQLIKYNSRLPYEAISKKVGLTRNAIKNRINKLEAKKVIAGYKMMVDFRHFEKHSYKIFIRYNNEKLEQEKNLLHYLKAKAGDLATTSLLGRWNLDIEIHCKDAKELQQFIIEIRNKFPIIEDYEIVQILEDYGIDFYPKELNK